MRYLFLLRPQPLVSKANPEYFLSSGMNESKYRNRSGNPLPSAMIMGAFMANRICLG